MANEIKKSIEDNKQHMLKFLKDTVSIESTSAIKRLSKVVKRPFLLKPPLGVNGKLKTLRKGSVLFYHHYKRKSSTSRLGSRKGCKCNCGTSVSIKKAKYYE